MDIKYAFFPEDNLLIQKFSGPFSRDEYIRHMGQLMQNSFVSMVKKVLIDFRDTIFDIEQATFQQNINKMVEVRKEMNARVPGDDGIIRVFWVDKPLPTVVAQLFTQRFPGSQYHFNSSSNAILHSLQLPAKYQDLESIVENIT